MRSQQHSRHVLAAYRDDTERLIGRRLPLLVGLFLAAVATSGVFEWVHYRERMLPFLGFFAAEIGVCGILTIFRKRLQRRRLLTATVTLAAVALGWLMSGYVTVAGADSQCR